MTPPSRSILRSREKHILLLTVATFVVFCVGGFFFLPELKAGTQFAYRQIKDAGPDLLGLIPPVDGGPTPGSNVGIEPPNYVYPLRVTARAKVSDMARLANKIKEERSAINKTDNKSQMADINRSQLGAVLPQPFPFVNGKVDSGPDARRAIDEAAGADTLAHSSEDWQPLELPSGEPSDPETKKRRDTVRGMMEHAWKNYVEFAWGDNELRPVSKRGHSPGIFGRSKLGLFESLRDLDLF